MSRQWVVSGVLAVSWRGITIHALAVAVGVALVVGGAGKLASALAGDGDERLVVGLSGLTNVIVGVLALSWPAPGGMTYRRRRDGRAERTEARS